MAARLFTKYTKKKVSTKLAAANNGKLLLYVIYKKNVLNLVWQSMRHFEMKQRERKDGFVPD